MYKKNNLLTSLILSAKKEYGDSAAFFSSFLPCSHCSAPVRKVAPPPLAPELANAFEFPIACEVLLLPLGLPFFFSTSSSSSSSSDKATPDRREALKEHEDKDLWSWS